MGENNVTMRYYTKSAGRYYMHIAFVSVLIACLLLLSVNEWVSLFNVYCDYDNGEGVSFIVKAILRWILDIPLHWNKFA